jgi:cytochrome b
VISGEGSTAARAVQIWPVWQRSLHWTLAAAILVALITYKGGRIHEASGYVALAAAALRVVLGFAGPRPARFVAFVRGPAAVLAHVRSLARGNPERHLNHTPLGGWMIVALLAFALVGAGTGALYVTDRFWGAAWVIRTHEISTWAFAVLAPLHVLGVIHASIVHRENLVRAMVDGRKRIDDRGDQPEGRGPTATGG